MKKLRYINLLLIALLITAVSCDPDDEPIFTEQELIFAKLAGSWTLKSGSSIMLDGQNVSLNYPGFAISSTDGLYATLNGGDLFNASGTWTWDDAEAGFITLDDGKEVTIVTLTETLFKFTFTISGTGGEVNGVDGTAGNYEVIVEK